MRVKSERGEYEVSFHADLDEAKKNGAFDITENGKCERLALNRFAIADANLAFTCTLIGAIPTFLFQANEEEKTLDSVHAVCRWLHQNRAGKHSVLFAVGGGIVQDIATMAAHLYHRGVSLIVVPTTLLSQADSCIGSKCGINLGGAKNQLGCFHPPYRVVVCSHFLDTLSDLDIQSGWGEILKLQLLGGYFRSLCEFKALRGPHLPLLIKSSLEVKKDYIEEDEFERGVRVMLNYGHTFGHALEAVTGNAVPHGVAVAWGIDVANFMGRGGVGTYEDYNEVKNFIREVLPYQIPVKVTAEQLVDAAMRDKKADASGVNMVLMQSPGRFVTRRKRREELLSHMTAYLEKENVYPCS